MELESAVASPVSQSISTHDGAGYSRHVANFPGLSAHILLRRVLAQFDELASAGVHEVWRQQF